MGLAHAHAMYAATDTFPSSDTPRTSDRGSVVTARLSVQCLHIKDSRRLASRLERRKEWRETGEKQPTRAIHDNPEIARRQGDTAMVRIGIAGIGFMGMKRYRFFTVVVTR